MGGGRGGIFLHLCLTLLFLPVCHMFACGSSFWTEYLEDKFYEIVFQFECSLNFEDFLEPKLSILWIIWLTKRKFSTVILLLAFISSLGWKHLPIFLHFVHLFLLSISPNGNLRLRNSNNPFEVGRYVWCTLNIPRCTCIIHECW